MCWGDATLIKIADDVKFIEYNQWQTKGANVHEAEAFSKEIDCHGQLLERTKCVGKTYLHRKDLRA